MYSPEERKIFSYTLPDGTTQYADPHRIQRLLNDATDNDYALLIMVCNKTANEAKYTRSQAVDKLVQAALVAFELPTVGIDQLTGQPTWFDRNTGQGWLEPELLNLLSSFNSFVSELKKSTGT